MGCRQVRETAANADVVLAGENALPVFSPSGVDSVALERIVYNTKVSLLSASSSNLCEASPILGLCLAPAKVMKRSDAGVTVLMLRCSVPLVTASTFRCYQLGLSSQRHERRCPLTVQAWAPPLQQMQMDDGQFSAVDGSALPPGSVRPPSGDSRGGPGEREDFSKDPRFADQQLPQTTLLPLRSFTFLRLTQEMTSPAYQARCCSLQP